VFETESPPPQPGEPGIGETDDDNGDDDGSQEESEEGE
jgi:hypothetical protein